jgi:hypothetical protein
MLGSPQTHLIDLDSTEVPLQVFFYSGVGVGVGLSITGFHILLFLLLISGIFSFDVVSITQEEIRI